MFFSKCQIKSKVLACKKKNIFCIQIIFKTLRRVLHVGFFVLERHLTYNSLGLLFSVLRGKRLLTAADVIQKNACLPRSTCQRISQLVVRECAPLTKAQTATAKGLVILCSVFFLLKRFILQFVLNKLYVFGLRY